MVGPAGRNLCSISDNVFHNSPSGAEQFLAIEFPRKRGIRPFFYKDAAPTELFPSTNIHDHGEQSDKAQQFSISPKKKTD